VSKRPNGAGRWFSQLAVEGLGVSALVSFEMPSVVCNYGSEETIKRVFTRHCPKVSLLVK
jgi:hypothetical protein